MRFPLVLSILALLPLSHAGPEGRGVLGPVARMRAERVELVPGDPAKRRLGALTYLGGVRLSSPDPAFGGFSSMRLEGDRFTLLSDGGNIVEFRMGADWRPQAIRFADLPGPGTGWRKLHRDSEAMTWDPATGITWVAFENRNAIWRYDRSLSRVQGRANPRAMARWPSAGGPESMTRLRDGSFVVIAESHRPKGQREARTGLRFPGDPVTGVAAVPFRYVPPARYDPVDIAELPDGRLLVLNRRFSVPGLFTAKLTLIDLRDVARDGVVRGRELATLESPTLHDNFEAVAIAREGDATILWIASDDNQEFWEASLLLKFRLELR